MAALLCVTLRIVCQVLFRSDWYIVVALGKVLRSLGATLL